MTISRAVTRLLLHNLDQAFDGRAWHGTPLGRAVRGLTVKQALWRPGRRRHNIWELILHTAYWKHMIRRRLFASTLEKFPHPGANWPRLPSPASEGALARDVKLLHEQHAMLLLAVANFPAARLSRRGTRWSPLEQILGVAAHDLYHGGQIQLLKRLYPHP